jgi:hypothetical protein
MPDDLEATRVHVVVSPLHSWPDDQVRRAYRLLVGAVRQLAFSDARPHEVDDVRLDAELFGTELVRRGLL